MELPQEWITTNCKIAASRIEAGIGTEQDILIDYLACRLDEVVFTLGVVMDRAKTGEPQGLAIAPEEDVEFDEDASEITITPEGKCVDDFREVVLVNDLSSFNKVTVDLSNFNRYTRSDFKEIFGKLISENGFTLDQLRSRLYIKHEMCPSLVLLAWSIMEKESGYEN